MCLQETRSRSIWKKSCFQEADMIIIPLSSLQAGFSLLLSACCIVSPLLSSSPPPSAVTQLWYHPAAGGRPTPSIIQPGRVHVSVLCCSVLFCRAVHGQHMLKYMTVYFDKSAIVLLLWSFLQGALSCYVRGPGSWRSHDLPALMKTAYYCYCNLFTFSYSLAFWASSKTRNSV